MVYNRENNIKGFKGKKFYKVSATINKDEQEVKTELKTNLTVKMNCTNFCLKMILQI